MELADGAATVMIWVALPMLTGMPKSGAGGWAGGLVRGDVVRGAAVVLAGGGTGAGCGVELLVAGSGVGDAGRVVTTVALRRAAELVVRAAGADVVVLVAASVLLVGLLVAVPDPDVGPDVGPDVAVVRSGTVTVVPGPYCPAGLGADVVAGAVGAVPDAATAEQALAIRTTATPRAAPRCRFTGPP